MILPVPHLLQETPVSCVPASVRMVLAYWGIERTELELSALLEADRRGTSVMNIEFLPAGVDVTIVVGELGSDALKRFLDQHIPVVVGVWTASLPYWHGNRSHAVVVVGYDEQFVYLNDPRFPDAPQTVTWDEFLEAWEEFGRFGAVLRRP